MSRSRPPRIAEIYLDAHWRPAPPDQRLDRETATALRDEGITMVRVAPPAGAALWRYVTGRQSGTTGRDISLSRYLASGVSAGELGWSVGGFGRYGGILRQSCAVLAGFLRSARQSCTCRSLRQPPVF